MIQIIAEIGSSHNGSLDTARNLIESAAKAGADWAKFQLFSGDDLWHPSDPRLATTRRVALPEAWLPELMRCCDAAKIRFLCTPFSVRAVTVLEDWGVSAYKIASGDVTFIPLLEAVAKTRKPVFLSVGGADWNEIDRAVDILDGELTLLHCDVS